MLTAYRKLDFTNEDLSPPPPAFGNASAVARKHRGGVIFQKIKNWQSTVGSILLICANWRELAANNLNTSVGNPQSTNS